MVAKITIPGSIGRALNYNEQKVKAGKAKQLYAGNFLKDIQNMNFYEKMFRFEQLIQLNQRAKTNCIHVSLNFSPKEVLHDDKLRAIGVAYMEQIGFGNQPFLIYKHIDAGHPHIHIVSTNIQQDGKRISLHNIGKEKSEPARIVLENKFRLQKAAKKQEFSVAPFNDSTRKIIYGKSETKRSISNVLDNILKTYRYGSLAELNAVLQLYNVFADRGSKDSVMYQKKGLAYRILDAKGNKIGIPIKASSLYNKPTLAFLEKKFEENITQKTAYKSRVKSVIDWILVHPPKDLSAFELALKREHINLVVRKNEIGIIYGLTYVDHKSRCVFNGSDIGKAYSAKAILEKCASPLHKTLQCNANDNMQTGQWIATDESVLSNDANRILSELLSPIESTSFLPTQLRRRKKKKKKNP